MEKSDIDNIIINALLSIGYSTIHEYYSKTNEQPKITYNLIAKQSLGQKLLRLHEDSPKKIFEDNYPNYQWGLLHFKKPNREKNDREKNRQILLNIIIKCGYASFENYYNTCLDKENKIGYYEIMNELGGSGILSNCERSPLIVFQTWVDEYIWNGYMFKNLPNNFYEDDEILKQWFCEFENEHNIKNPDDWYKISSYQIISKNKGNTIYGNYFGSSMINIMKYLYPTYNWLEWLIENGAPNGFWKEHKNCKKYLLWLGEILEFTNYDDWYNLSGRTIIDNHGSGLFDRYNNNIYNLISGIFNDKEDWDKNGFIRHTTEKIYGEYLNSISEIKYGRYCIDNCINIRHLPFDFGNEQSCDIHEVDGEQHFYDNNYFNSKYRDVQKRDIKKILDALAINKKIIRICQIDVYLNRINWKEIIKNLLTTINDDDTHVYFVSLNQNLYKNHIELLLSQNPNVKYKIITAV